MGPALSVVLSLSAVASVAVAQRPTGAMSVRVADVNDSTLTGAAIILPTLDVTFAVPATGKLLIRDVAPGTYLVQARRLGYAQQTKMLRVGKDTAQVSFTLLPASNELDTVRVTEIAGTWQADFLRRQKLGFGQFFPLADILAAHADRLTSLLRNVRGIVVTPQRGTGVDQITLSRSAGDCKTVAIYLDGVLMNGSAVVQTAMVTKQQSGKSAPPPRATNPPVVTPPSQPTGQEPPASRPTARQVYQATQESPASALGTEPSFDAGGSFDPNVVPLSFVGGIEVYTNSATIPPEYKKRSNACGVILLWTK